MAKRRPKVASSFSIEMLAISITTDGGTHHFGSVNWQRQVKDDGTVIETGRPPGLPEGAGPGDAIAQALDFVAQQPRKRGRRGK